MTEVSGVLSLVFYLFVNGKVIKFVHVLQIPKVVMQLGHLLAVFHYLAQVQELQIYCMHVHKLPFVLF